MFFLPGTPGEIMENFKSVNETIIEERKAEIVENFVCDTCGHKSTSARKLRVHCQKVFNKMSEYLFM